MDWRDVEKRLCERAEEVCRHLLPQGKREGAEYVCGSTAGEAGNSLKVNLGGNAGLWSDFAASKGGKTLMSLWCAVRGQDFKPCIREAKGFLGIRDDYESRFHRPGGGESAATLDPNVGLAGRGPGFDHAAVSNVKKLSGGCGVMNFLVEGRKLDPIVLDAYRVGQTLDGRAIVYPYFATETDQDEAVMWRKQEQGQEQEIVRPSWLKFEGLERKEGKKVEWTTRGPAKCLFGKNAIPRKQREVIITEGEKDALAWATYGIAAVSVPFGAKWRGQDKGRPSPNREWIDRDLPWLENFETIFVCMDMDGPGQRAAMDIINEIGPRRCRHVLLPTKPAEGAAATLESRGPERWKDANDCLMAVVTVEEMKACLTGAREFAPERVHNALEYEEEFFEEWFTGHEEPGLAMPINFPFRIRSSELTVWSGFSGHGKTKFLNQTICCLAAQGERCCIASMETRTRTTLHHISRQAYGAAIWDKHRKNHEAGWSDETRERKEKEARAEGWRVLRWLGERLWFYDHVGIVPWRQLLDDFRWVRRRYGVTQFVVDSLMRCGLMEDDYAGQAEFVTAFASFCMDLNVHGHLVAHRKKNERGERQGGDGDKSVVAGSEKIVANAHNVVEMWRNVMRAQKLSELEDKARVGLIKVEEAALERKKLGALPGGKFMMRKQREGEVQDGSRMVWFLQESFQFTDYPPDHREHRSVSYVGAEGLQEETELAEK